MGVESLTLYIDLAIALLLLIISLCGAVGSIIIIYALIKWRI